MQTNSEAYSPQEFFQRLTRNELGSTVALAGLINESESDDQYASFVVGTECTDWRRIPLSLIDSIQPVRTISCNDHTHPLVKLRLKEPTSDEARLLMSFVTDVQREAQRLIQRALTAASVESSDPGCLNCLQGCSGVIEPGDVFLCFDYCLRVHCKSL
ncbi:hypothetical protein AB0M58_38775 [Streptomyces bobili]|uniref:hypothetical protein n=1 Tax=Streptomyces bobili TaxID=67280 RepID=UPI00343F8641